MLVRDGQLDNARELMDEMVTSTLDESGTRGYEWFLSEDGGHCHINERYADSDAVMAHLGNFGEKWSLRGSAEVFAFEYDDFDGSLYDFYAGLDYQFFDHVAIGVGVNSVKMNLGVTKSNFNGDLDWRYDGGLLFFKFDF